MSNIKGVYRKYMKKIVSVVVTYNRLPLLKKCIESLLNQSVELSKIIIVDNFSTDGTKEYLKNVYDKNEKVIYIRLDKNLGGAGGFSEGIKNAVELECDYLWLMDDDTIPKVDSLERLLDGDKVLKGKWGFLSSNVRWINESPAKMNQLSTKKFWSEYVADGLIAVETGTFVSLLIKKCDVLSIGLPLSEFFIWGDDTEYTVRLSKINTGYFVSNSVVIHETKNNVNVNIINERDPNRIGRYFYSFRNSYYNARVRNEKLHYFMKSVITSLNILKSKDDIKWKKINVLYRGLFAGFFFKPKVRKL